MASHSKTKSFHCKICKISMQYDSKTNHMNGKKHILKSIKLNLIKTPQKYYYCACCDKLMNAKQKHNHLKDNNHCTNMEKTETTITTLKQKGNDSFKNKNYNNAIESYTIALSHNIYMNTKNKLPSSSLITLKQALLLNRSKSYFHTEKPKLALKDAIQCINTDKASKISYKARYIRAEINQKLQNFESALTDCNQILELQMSNEPYDETLMKRAKVLISQLNNYMEHDNDTESKQNDNDLNLKCDQSFVNCPQVQHILHALQYYKLNTNNNSLCDYLGDYDGVKIMKDVKHFINCHSNDALCNDKQCFIVKRHILRNRTLYNSSNKAEVKEVSLLQYLDQVHCTLLHKNDSIVSNNLKDKFVTHIPETSVHKNNELPMYQFGSNISYWATDSHRFVMNKYANLKDEYLNNSLHSIDLFQFDLLVAKSLDFIQIYKSDMIKAKRDIVRMRGAVKMDEEMNLKHIMVIKSYCDLDKLQRKYKNGCKKITQYEQLDTILKRNSEIAIWCKLFLETVCCFGDILKPTESIYHGLNTKLRFDKMGTMFNLPTSCTRSLGIAQRFATPKGIIIKMQRNESLNEWNYYFDVYSKYSFSSYPNEKENILFGASLGFTDIIYKDIFNTFNHSEYILSLRLYQLLIEGNWFAYDKNLFKDKHLKLLINLMKCWMNEKSNQCDEYLLYLLKTMTLNNYSEGQYRLIFMNKMDYKKLPNAFQDVFLKEFAPFLRSQHKINFEENIHLPSMNIDMKKFESSKKLWKPQYSYYQHNIHLGQIRDKITFYYEFERVDDDFMGFFGVKSMGKCLESMYINYIVYFPQISYQLASAYLFSHNELVHGGKLFDLRLLSGLKSLKIHIAFHVFTENYMQTDSRKFQLY